MAWQAACFIILALADGAFLSPGKEPLTFSVAKDREQHELEVVDADRQIAALEDQRYQSTVDELRRAQKAVETQAAAAAEEAQAAEEHVEELEMKQQVLLAKAKDFSAQQKEQVKYAEKSNKEMEKALEAAKALAKTADGAAKDLAKSVVKQWFSQKYQQLQPWHDEVLVDHYAEGRHAALAAARPYEHAMGQAMEKATSYETTAESLSSVAKSLATEADRATLTAAEKRMAGDADGALRLSAAAQQMRKHLRELKAYAKELQHRSTQLAESAPKFLSSAQRAAQRAEWRANPEALPPTSGVYLPP